MKHSVTNSSNHTSIQDSNNHKHCNSVKVDKNHATPFYLACAKGDLNEVEKIAKDKNFNPDDLNSYGACGSTPLQVAVINGHVKVVRFLLTQKGVDVNARVQSLSDNRLEINALYLAMDYLPPTSKSKGYNNRMSILKQLLRHEAIDVKNVHSDLGIGLLIDLVIEIITSSGQQLKVLHDLFDRVIDEACSEDNLKKFQSFLNSKKQYVQKLLDLQNSQGITLLHLAINKYCEPNLDLGIKPILEEIIMSLLDYPINVLSKDKNDNTILHSVAIRYKNNKDLFDKIIFLEEEVLKKVLGIFFGNRDDKGSFLANQVHKMQQTAAHIAVEAPNPALAKILMPWTDLTIQDTKGNTLLHSINSIEILETVTTLIEEEKLDASDIEQTLYQLHNRKGQTAFELLLNQVAHLFRNDPKDSNLDRYMKCIYTLNEYRTKKNTKVINSIDDLIKFERVTHTTTDEAVELNKDKKQCSVCGEELCPTNDRQNNHLFKTEKHGYLHAWCLIRKNLNLSDK